MSYKDKSIWKLRSMILPLNIQMAKSGMNFKNLILEQDKRGRIEILILETLDPSSLPPSLSSFDLNSINIY